MMARLSLTASGGRRLLPFGDAPPETAGPRLPANPPRPDSSFCLRPSFVEADEAVGRIAHWRACLECRACLARRERLIGRP